ncbi:MAG: FAD-dependent oxidoreductase [Steroidobacteraceae bacterium]
MYDVIVIGAGPAGLCAAVTANALGLRVLLLDEQAAPGGQVYRDVARTCERRSTDAKLLGRDYVRGLNLIERLGTSSVTYLPRTRVWHIDAARLTAYYCTDGQTQLARASALILAHGAIERPLPIPGWTLPGVMAAGAAQTLLKSTGIVPSAPIVLAGNGPLLLLLATQLHKAGAEIALIAQTTRWQDYLRASTRMVSALRAPAYLSKGMRLQLDIARSSIATRHGLVSLSAQGTDRLEQVTLVFRNSTLRVPANVLLLHQGVIPNTQITRLLRLEHEYDSAARYFRPRVNAFGESSRPGIFIAGDGTSILGARAAELSGRLAAWAIAARLGKISARQEVRATGPLRKQLGAERAARGFLDALFPPSRIATSPEDATLVCRCHEVTARQIAQTAQDGCGTADQVKASLRCGMGPCQGRLCASVTAALIAATRGVAPADMPMQHVRPPLQPLTLGELASL